MARGNFSQSYFVSGWWEVLIDFMEGIGLSFAAELWNLFVSWIELVAGGEGRVALILRIVEQFGFFEAFRGALRLFFNGTGFVVERGELDIHFPLLIFQFFYFFMEPRYLFIDVFYFLFIEGVGG